MMLMLWRKELRLMLPFLSLAVIIPLLGILYEILTSFPNMRPWAVTYRSYVISSTANTTMIAIFVLALASGLLVREHDEGTIEFLDSLPLTRSRVFFAKISIALAVLFVLTMLDAVTTPLLHAFSRTSVDRSFHMKFWFIAVGIRMCQVFVLLGLGVACSFLRRFGWLIIGLLFWAYILLHEFIPEIAVLNILSLTRQQYEGEEWIIPQHQLTIQLALGSVLMLTAYVLFLGGGDVLMRGFRRLTRSRLGNAFLLSGGLLVGVMALSLAYYEMRMDPDSRDGSNPNAVKVEFPSWGTSRARNRYYEFIYPTNLAARALLLVDKSDDVHELVRKFFDTDSGEPILVDATNEIPRHAGLAYWEKIRLDLTASEKLPVLESILGHETAHVFLERLSDSRLREQLNSTRFFHEGVASYIEYHLFNSGRDVGSLRRIAAATHDRDQVDFKELVDNSLLEARRDGNLVYSLGELFVAELIARHGEAAVVEIVRAIAREDAPESLSGLELWRDLFQSCGYDFDAMLDAFYTRLNNEVEIHRDFIAGIPKIRASMDREDYLVEVQVHWKPVDDWQPTCRFRQTEHESARLYRFGIQKEPDTFVCSSSYFVSSTVWYQAGLRYVDGTVIYEPWTAVSLRD